MESYFYSYSTVQSQRDFVMSIKDLELGRELFLNSPVV